MRRPSREVARLILDALQVPPAEREPILQRARQPLADPVAGTPALVPAAAPRRAKAALELPAAPTPLIGRADEQAELRRLLADPACRVITLVGPGGIGKTRLALHTAADAAEGEIMPVALQALLGIATLLVRAQRPAAAYAALAAVWRHPATDHAVRMRAEHRAPQPRRRLTPPSYRMPRHRRHSTRWRRWQPTPSPHSQPPILTTTGKAPPSPCPSYGWRSSSASRRTSPRRCWSN